MFVCLFVSNKRQTAKPIGPKLYVGSGTSAGKDLWIIKISKISLKQNSIFIKFWKSMKIFIKYANFFISIYKERMFIIKVEDGRAKSLEVL